jgi:ribonuclease III
MNQNLDDLQLLIGVKFKHPPVLHQALVHRSYLNENKTASLQSNERYEFLGDAVLELWASQTLFKLFPDYPEGKLTNLRSLVVCTENLALVAATFDLGKYVLLSRGEETHHGRENQSILADTFESLIGAVFLDSGTSKTFKFLDQILLPSLNNISQQKIYKDPKSLFQEIAQAQQGITPHYQTISESGPDHLKTFVVGVFLDQKLIAEGEGNSKQKAEEAAAVAGYQKLAKS